MIVILGDEHDVCNLLVYQELCQRRVDVVFIKETEFLTTMGISWVQSDPERESFISLADRNVPLATISGVLVRLRSLFAVPTDMTEEDQQYVRYELHATLIGWLNALDCMVVNRPLPGLEAGPIGTNIDNMRQVLACGLQLPAAMVTSSYECACQFYDRHGQRVSLRTPSGQRPWQRIEGAAGRQALHDMVLKHPIYLQDFPAGRRFQVVTVGHQVFSAVATAGCETWEAPLLAVKPCQLPADIKD